MKTNKNTREALTRVRESLISYLLQKQQVEDWHAVQDAGSDLREVDAKLEILDELDHSSSRSGAGS